METTCGGSGMSGEVMKQPEALRLADALDAEFVQGRISNSTGRESAVELRRLHEALETEQEPVAWMHNFIEGNVITHIPADIGRHPERWTPLYTTPCQTCVSLAMTVMNDQTYHEKVIPKREWVGLTLNEAEDFYEKYTDRAELINAIDKFLEEKNNG